MISKDGRGDCIVNDQDIQRLKHTLQQLRQEGKVRLSLLFGSCARGHQHERSDIDLALYLARMTGREETEIIDRILLSADRHIEILRLDDEDESPFIVQEALKGVHLVEPDTRALYEVSHRALHESESIRFRRETAIG